VDFSERQMTVPHGFLEALTSPQRAAELSDEVDIFGFLIGSWDLDAVLYDSDGATQSTRGELHACWVLEGRAIQDLFIFPRRADRASGIPARGDRYATTIRTYDRVLNAWRVNFINPADQKTSARLVARRDGQDIAMEGELADSLPIRWRYQAITPESFHYSAETLQSDGRTWQLYLELFGKRSGA
jgi:hypothetical protein